ncbi:hypothetical protein PMAYCL1PPCAC_01292, partial [Pristionchus mayeri]
SAMGCNFWSRFACGFPLRDCSMVFVFLSFLLQWRYVFGSCYSKCGMCSSRWSSLSSSISTFCSYLVANEVASFISSLFIQYYGSLHMWE